MILCLCPFKPVPNSFSPYFHFMPKAWHRFEVWSNHFVELLAPFMLLMPFREWRLAGGLIQIIFQLVLISSGNLRYVRLLYIFLSLFHLLTLSLHLPIQLPKLANNCKFNDVRLIKQPTNGLF